MTANPYVASFLSLSEQVHQAGLMGRRYDFYWPRILFWTLSTLVTLVMVVLLGDTWYQLLLAGFLGLAMSQLGFLSHEATHQEIFKSRGWNEWTARVLGGLFIGLSYGWWTDKHSRHHANPNKEGWDPDVDPGVFAMTPGAAAQRTGLKARLAKYQGLYFLPLLPFEGFSLHVSSVRSAFSSKRMKHRWVEILFLSTRLIGLPLFLLIVLPFWLAVAFLLVQVLVFGFLLGGAFAPNHIGMPSVPHDARIDFFRRQVRMSRNIKGGRVVNFLMGGLQYQVEHHLFPRIARPHLPALQKLVREQCSQLNVPYTETTLMGAYATIISYLNQVGLRNRNLYTCPLVLQYRG